MIEQLIVPVTAERLAVQLRHRLISRLRGRDRALAVRPPPRPQRVLDPRRRMPDRPAGGSRRRAGHARDRAHRPRVDGGRGRAQPRSPTRPGVKPVLGCEVYVVDDHAARPQKEQRAPPDAAGRDDRGLPQPDPAGLAAATWTATGTSRGSTSTSWRRTPTASSRSPAACPGASARRWSTATRPARASELDRLVQIFGRDDVYVEIQDGGIDVQTRILPDAGGAGAATPGCRWSAPATSTT